MFFDVVREPSHATVKVSLKRERGTDDKQYWRIVQVGFSDPRRPSPASRPIARRRAATSQPAASTAAR